MGKTRFGITMGDPLGVGPEVLAKALKQIEGIAREDVILFGDANILAKHNLESSLIDQLCKMEWRGPVCSASPGAECEEGGRCSIEYLDLAIEAIQNGEIDGLVTGPLSKSAVQMTRPGFVGHTGYLGDGLGAEETVMCFYGEHFNLALLTHHIPLNQVSDALLRLNLERICETALSGFEILLGKKVNVKLAGLNPHAGEAGLLGTEESRLRELIQHLGEQYEVSGPWPGDTLFTPAGLKGVDVVIACYHDQGLIPYKMVHFHKGVNVTFGLPVMRFSVDHGTAYSLVGKNEADPGSMIQALELMLSVRNANPVN